MTNSKHTYWLPIAIVAAFLAVAIFGLVTYANTIAIRNSEQNVARSYAIREATQQLLAAMRDTETGQRGFLLTGDDEFLAPYESGLKKADEQFLLLRNLVSNDADLQSRVGQLHGAFDQQQAHFRQTIDLRRSQPAGRVSEEVLDLVKSGRGRLAMEDARRAAAGIVTAESEQLEQSEQATNYLSSISRATITAGNLLALGLILFAGVAAYLDRNKRRQAESKLVDSQDRQRAFVAALGQVREAIVICDLQDKVRSWNQGAATLYGIEEFEAIGKNICEILFAGDCSNWNSDRDELSRRGCITTQRSRVLPNGREVVVEERRSLISDENNHPNAQLLFVVDITDRVREEVKQRRVQRLESIGTLAGGIAHDLNNVLTPIVMSAKLLRRGSGKPERLIDNIVTSADRGGKMIKKLLAFAGGEDGNRSAVDLREVLAEIKEILSHTLQHSIDLKVSMPATLRTIYADATELSQVIMNLAINARDAMPRGGRIAIEVEDYNVKQLRADSSDILNAGPHVLLTVSDNGDGISKEIIDRIFDPFFTTKAQGKGTGLGLATSLGIVRSYGGDITVESELNKGTKFSIYLPSSKLSAELIKIKEDEVAAPIGKSETILIVDDELMILEVARETLESNQYNVITASSGREAITICQNSANKINAVLLDMMMPGIDGLETKNAIRQTNPSALIIASSGLRHPNHEDRLQDVDGFLPKPYTDDQLLRLVRIVLDKKTSSNFQ